MPLTNSTVAAISVSAVVVVGPRRPAIFLTKTSPPTTAERCQKVGNRECPLRLQSKLLVDWRRHQSIACNTEQISLSLRRCSTLPREGSCSAFAVATLWSISIAERAYHVFIDGYHRSQHRKSSMGCTSRNCTKVVRALSGSEWAQEAAKPTLLDLPSLFSMPSSIRSRPPMSSCPASSILWSRGIGRSGMACWNSCRAGVGGRSVCEMIKRCSPETSRSRCVFMWPTPEFAVLAANCETEVIDSFIRLMSVMWVRPGA
jgi:hypothetical protein